MSPVHILSQLDPVHTLTSHFLKIHLNIIIPFTLWSLKRSLSLRFPHQNLVYASPLPHTRYMSHPSHYSRCDHPKILGEQYRSLSSSLCSFLHTSLLGQNILLSTLFANTPNLNHPSIWASKFHTHTKQVNIMVLDILTFKFLDSKLQDTGFCRYFSLLPSPYSCTGCGILAPNLIQK